MSEWLMCQWMKSLIVRKDRAVSGFVGDRSNATQNLRCVAVSLVDRLRRVADVLRPSVPHPSHRHQRRRAVTEPGRPALILVVQRLVVDLFPGRDSSTTPGSGSHVGGSSNTPSLRWPCVTPAIL